MRQIHLIVLPVLLGLGFSITAKAEYEGYYFKLRIETANGGIISAYIARTAHFFKMDSVKDPAYITRRLLEQGKSDSFSYFRNRISYDYDIRSNNVLEKHRIYALLDKTAMPEVYIRNISVEEVIEFSYTMNIASEVKLSDTLWMKKPPLKKLSFNGYLCSYSVYVHEDSARLNELVKQLRAVEKKYEGKELGQDYLGDEMDKELSDIIQKLNGLKAITISFCTC